ncbi:MAG: alpha/beta hydrolase [Bacteroidetes bacterium]|nr:alpha/beta hydrolase [Bacteroidota bacterium]
MSKDIGQRHSGRFHFRDGLMDFNFGWALGNTRFGGLSIGELFYHANRIHDGDVASWTHEFQSLMEAQFTLAERSLRHGSFNMAAERYLAASQSARYALHFTERDEKGRGLIYLMELGFQNFLRYSGTNLKSFDFQFKEKHLPAYVSKRWDSTMPICVVIGGGDTFREDLFYLGGYPALNEQYNVVLVDLPGQGKTPYSKLFFGMDTIEAVSVVLDTIEKWSAATPVVLLGFSGGGFITTYAAISEPRVFAWAASTPIYDFAHLFEKAFPSLFKKTGTSFLIKWIFKFMGKLSTPRSLAMRTYQWQFGVKELSEVITSFRELGKLDYHKISRPGLVLIGESEDVELKEQANDIFEDLVRRVPSSRKVVFPVGSGADAHCQVHNLQSAQYEIFTWFNTICKSAESK